MRAGMVGVNIIFNEGNMFLLFSLPGKGYKLSLYHADLRKVMICTTTLVRTPSGYSKS